MDPDEPRYWNDAEVLQIIGEVIMAVIDGELFEAHTLH